MSTEFDLIDRIARRVPGARSVLHGIGDDAAVLRPQPGLDLVATTDSLVPGRHFLDHWSPADIGHLALAVNLSDLAAMGARPRWALLALTLPEGDAAWLDAFLDGFLGLADHFGLHLVGGNLARGPLNIGVQLLGDVEPERVVTRQGAQAGDLLAVTGSLGDAAAALMLGESAPAALTQRLRRPSPRVAAGRCLAVAAHAMLDISDGLLADLSHLLPATGPGAELELDALPASPALLEALPDHRKRREIQARGGSDYELLVSLPGEHFEGLSGQLAELDCALTVIGRVVISPGIRLLDADGDMIDIEPTGWDHFS